MRTRWMLLATSIAACSGEKSYTDAEARAAMGARADANPLHHDRYTDAECLGAVAGAGYVAGPHFSGSWADLAGRPDLGRLEGEVGGRTSSHGCTDHSPEPPDCGTCTSCLVGGGGYPATSDWAWLASFTPPSDGVLDVLVGPLLVCDPQRVVPLAEVRVEIRLQERAGFPLPDDAASLLLGWKVVRLESLGQGWARPSAEAPFHLRVSTTADDDPRGGQGILRPGVPSVLFAKTVPSAGLPAGACALTPAEVVIRLTPLLANADITPG